MADNKVVSSTLELNGNILKGRIKEQINNRIRRLPGLGDKLVAGNPAQYGIKPHHFFVEGIRVKPRLSLSNGGCHRFGDRIKDGGHFVNVVRVVNSEAKDAAGYPGSSYVVVGGELLKIPVSFGGEIFIHRVEEGGRAVGRWPVDIGGPWGKLFAALK